MENPSGFHVFTEWIHYPKYRILLDLGVFMDDLEVFCGI